MSAVIVFFRSEASIFDCLASLTSQTVPPSEVIVVANSPIRPHVAHALAVDGATVVDAGSNLGFGAACNVGARRCASRYLLFINPDARCERDMVERLVDVGAAGGIVGPAVRSRDGKIERSVKSESYVTAWVLIAREALVGRWLHLGSPRPPLRRQRVDILSGACLLMRREVFESIGGFDDRFFLYGEDVDLSYRAARLGIDRTYEPTASAVHLSGTGSGSPDEDVLAIKGREARRAHALLLREHRGEWARRRYLMALGPVLRLRLLAALACRRAGEVTKARSALQWLASEPR